MKVFFFALGLALPGFAAVVDLRDAVVVVRPGTLPKAEKTAAIVLVEEVEKRTGVRLTVSTNWPADRTVIAITGESKEMKPEGYRLFVDQTKAQAAVRIIEEAAGQRANRLARILYPSSQSGACRTSTPADVPAARVVMSEVVNPLHLVVVA